MYMLHGNWCILGRHWISVWLHTILCFCNLFCPVFNKVALSVPAACLAWLKVINTEWAGMSMTTIYMQPIIPSYYSLTGMTFLHHYGDVIMSAMASQITSLRIVCSPIYSGADQRKHQSSSSLVFVQGIQHWPVNSSHKGPVMQKMFPFDDMETHFCEGDPLVTNGHWWIPLTQGQ